MGDQPGAKEKPKGNWRKASVFLRGLEKCKETPCKKKNLFLHIDDKNWKAESVNCQQICEVTGTRASC